MARRVRWLVLAVVLLIAVAAGAAWLTVRPDLDSARDRVDAAWTLLRAPLATRYQALDGVAKALTDAGAGDRAVTADLERVLARWHPLALLGPHHTDAAVEATVANELEAQARRVDANVSASTKLGTNPAITAAVVAFGKAVVPPPLVKAYNRAAHAYEDARSGTLHRLVADIFGYDARPVLVLGT
jgi:hypothetical protein